jgi:hypothetical protein
MKGFIAIGGLRIMLLLLLGLMLASTAGCGGGGGAVRESDGAGKGKKKDPEAPTVSVVYNNGYQFSVNGKDMQILEIIFAGGAHEAYPLSKKGTCFSATRDAITEIGVMSKSGDYWYFDNMGDPIPEDERQTSGLLSGTLGLLGKILHPKPVIKVSCTGGPYTEDGTKTTSSLGSVLVSVSSSALYSQVKVATSTDQVLTYSTSATYSGTYDTQTTVTVDAVRVTLAADGSKWYFDSAGNILPLDSKWYQDLD